MGKQGISRLLCAYETNLPGSAAEKLAQRADLESMLNQLEEESVEQATANLGAARIALADGSSDSDVARLEEFYTRPVGVQDFSSVGTLSQRQALKAAMNDLRAAKIAEAGRARDTALGPPKCFTIGCYDNP